MKKRVLSLVMSLALVAATLLSGTTDTKADSVYSVTVYYVSEVNADNIVPEYSATIWDCLQQYFFGGVCANAKPGSVVKAGDVINTGAVIGSTAAYYSETELNSIITTDVYGKITNTSLFVAENPNSPVYLNLLENDGEDGSEITIKEVDGITSWKVTGIELVSMGTMLFACVLILVPAEAGDYKLETTGNTTKWMNPKGEVVWTVTEDDTTITADLTDCSALNKDIVAAWKAANKDVTVSYKYKGYTVKLSVPAGELADTGADWYGPEYLAAVNAEYVTVTDWFGVNTDLSAILTK